MFWVVTPSGVVVRYQPEMEAAWNPETLISY